MDAIYILYKDIFCHILSYLSVTDLFHLKQTSKKIFERIKQTFPMESEILDGSICTICHQKYEKPSKQNKVIMICSKKHPLSSHFHCWQKWKQQNIGVVTTEVFCFLQSCPGYLKKVGGTTKKPKPTKLRLNKQLDKARLNTLNTIIRHNTFILSAHIRRGQE